MKPATIRHGVTPDQFHAEVRPAAQPVLLKGLVDHWPIVAAARSGTVALAEAITANATSEAVVVNHGAYEIGGRFHYAEGGARLNFERTRMPLARFMAILLAEIDNPQPRALAAQGQKIQDFLPRFAQVHPLPLLSQAVQPRMWIGNASIVATHGDDLENIACCAAGHRRFTLFPPDEIGNLYMGPFELTPGGTPISMVDVTRPDLSRYPRFAKALDAAIVAELEPGDALYVPYQWYHHVEALDPVNVLVNYWWDESRADLGSRWDALLHAIIALRSLPDDQRHAWRAMFDHYAFLMNGDPGAHLPLEMRGLLGCDTPEYMDQLQRDLRANLDPGNQGKAGPLK